MSGGGTRRAEAARRGATRYIPPAGPPTRHPRPGALSAVRTGERLTVHFSAVNPDGSAVARVGSALIGVPFGVPGEEAVVEVTKGGRYAEGRLVALLRKAPEVIRARCRHFGRCGGCQWQHLTPALQRQLKTRMVKDYLKEHAGVRRDLVADAIGGDAWAYRNTIRAVLAVRGGEVIAGYHASGASRVLDVIECPVQHPANVAMLEAVRRAVRLPGLSPYEPSAGHGLVRGFVGLVSFATGQALLTLSLTAPPPDPAAIVHALIDQVPGLVGILATVQSPSAADLLGPRARLLWGRDTVEEEIGGFRLRLRPGSDLPANPRAMTLLVDAVVRAAALRPDERGCDFTAATPLFTLAIAAGAESAVGVVPGRREVAEGWETAGRNGVTNVAFTTRDVLSAAASRPERLPQAVVLTARGAGLDETSLGAVRAAGVPRVVYVARTLGACAHDLPRWRAAGYAAASVQPVDLLPQTSHVHLVVALVRAR